MPKLYGGKLATVRLWGVLNLELRDGYKANSAKWASQRNCVDERRCPRPQDAFEEQTPVVKISKLMTRSEGACNAERSEFVELIEPFAYRSRFWVSRVGHARCTGARADQGVFRALVKKTNSLRIEALFINLEIRARK
jgi:hypothetical protein